MLSIDSRNISPQNIINMGHSGFSDSQTVQLSSLICVMFNRSVFETCYGPDTTFLSTAKHGDNALGSICPPIRLSISERSYKCSRG